MDDLFAGTEHEKVRAKRRVMMHVADAGQHNSIKVGYPDYRVETGL